MAGHRSALGSLKGKTYLITGANPVVLDLKQRRYLLSKGGKSSDAEP